MDKHPSRRPILKSIGVIGVTGSLTSQFGAASAADRAPVSEPEAARIAEKYADHLGTRSEFEEWHNRGVTRGQLFQTKTRDKSNRTDIQVHSGYNEPPDRVKNGNWNWAQVTRGQVE